MLLSSSAVGAILVQVFLAHRRDQGKLRGNVVNPHFILATISAVFLLDFLLLWEDSLHGTVVVLRNMQPSSPDMVLNGFRIFALGLAALSVGSILAHLVPTRRRFVVPKPKHNMSDQATILASALVIAASLPLLVSIIASAGLDFSRITAERQIFFQNRQLQYFLTSLNLPAAVGILARRNWTRLDTALLSTHFLLLTLLGGRSILIFIALAFLVAIARRGIRLPTLSLPLLFPAGFFVLAVMRYWLRERVTGVGIIPYILGNGGFISSAFNSIEISISHALSTIAEFPTTLKLAPFESFYAGLVYLVPRELLLSKPLGASTEFSMLVHPEHWARYHSETLVSGFGDLYMMFGFWELPVLVLFGLVFTRQVLKHTRREARGFVLANSYLIILSVVFLRGDLYNLAHYAWGLIVFQIMVFGLLLFLRALRTAKRVRQRALNASTWQG